MGNSTRNGGKEGFIKESKRKSEVGRKHGWMGEKRTVFKPILNLFWDRIEVQACRKRGKKSPTSLV